MTFLIGSILTVVSIGLVLFVCYTLAKLALLFSGLVVVFSRLTFSFFIAIAVGQFNPIIPHENWNIALWFVIVVGLVYLFTRMPRVDYAMEFLTASSISCLVSKALLLILQQVILPMFGISFGYGNVIDIALTVVCIGYTAWSVKEKIQLRAAENTAAALPLPLTILERILAAFLYGFGILLLCALNNLLSADILTQWIVLICGSVAGLLFDLFVVSRLA